MLNIDKQLLSTIYNVARKWLTITPIVLFPLMFSSKWAEITRKKTTISANGLLSSLFINLSGPIFLAYTFMTSPLSFLFHQNPPIHAPQLLLAAMFVAHYVSHMFFDFSLTLASKGAQHDLLTHTLPHTTRNAIYGVLTGAFLTSPFARIFLSTAYTSRRTTFYVGFVLWLLGFAGSAKHARIMIATHQNALARQRKEDPNLDRDQDQDPILRGGLFEYVSHPRYLFEWIQWLGFALMGAPRPPLYLKWTFASVQGFNYLLSMLWNPANLFAQNLAPPYVILLAEVLLSLPRAYHGHSALKAKFGERYPRDKKAVIPFVF